MREREVTDYVCDVCGEYIQDDEPMAEVVDADDAGVEGAEHAFVHQTCYDSALHAVA